MSTMLVTVRNTKRAGGLKCPHCQMHKAQGRCGKGRDRERRYLKRRERMLLQNEVQSQIDAQEEMLQEDIDMWAAMEEEFGWDALSDDYWDEFERTRSDNFWDDEPWMGYDPEPSHAVDPVDDYLSFMDRRPYRWGGSFS